MKNFIINRFLLLVVSMFLGFSLFAGTQNSARSKEKFEVKLTPLGDCIYKIPDALDTENWVIFLNIMNDFSKNMKLESIKFDIYSKSKLISSETNCYNKNINSDSNYKLNLIFFRKKKSLDCDNMKVTVLTSLGKKMLDIKLERYKHTDKYIFPTKRCLAGSICL